MISANKCHYPDIVCGASMQSGVVYPHVTGGDNAATGH